MVGRKFIYLFLCSLIFMFLNFFINVKISKALEGACGACHTMHNSQNGTSMTFNGTGGPYRALVRGDCVYCHSDTGPKEAPTVVSMENMPNYTFGSTDNVTAGGNFYWVYKGNDAAGHNVVGIADQDDNIKSYTPPGWDQNYDSRRSDIGGSWGQQLTCAGKYGCHGDPSVEDQFAAISGAHHANKNCNSTAGNCDWSKPETSYRFLLGIKGTEDPNWELTLSKDDHNGYYAVDDDSDSGAPADTASINYLCGECHGKFHYETESGSSYASPWLRHPTDYDMNNVSGKEYGNYPGIFNGTLGTTNYGDYFAEVPVGNTQGEVLSTVTGTGKAIVLCISCHRAHGTPFADILRWGYGNCTAGNQNTNCGCFACHTSK